MGAVRGGEAEHQARAVDPPARAPEPSEWSETNAPPVEKTLTTGEVGEVTGHLGGYNFQWAWSSGFVAGEAA